jgi:hypothetical protein
LTTIKLAEPFLFLYALSDPLVRAHKLTFFLAANNSSPPVFKTFNLILQRYYMLCTTKDLAAKCFAQGDEDVKLANAKIVGKRTVDGPI